MLRPPVYGAAALHFFTFAQNGRNVARLAFLHRSRCCGAKETGNGKQDNDLSGRGAGKAVSKGWGRHAAIGGLAAVAAVSAVGFAAARSDDFGFGMGRFGMGGHVMHAHMGGGGVMEHRIGTMLDELDATPEQEDKLWDIIDNARAEIRPTFRDFRETREEVIELLGAPGIDRAAPRNFAASALQPLTRRRAR